MAINLEINNMDAHNLILSSLGHTWILDIDGTIVKHNGYKIDGKDTLLEGAWDFLKSIPENDMIIFVTSRTEEYSQLTLDFLQEHKIRYNHIIFNAPYGERIIVNDDKPSGLKCSVAVNLRRDNNNIDIIIDKNL